VNMKLICSNHNSEGKETPPVKYIP